MCVYFALGEITGRVKIGFSMDPVNRVKDVERQCSEPLQLVRIIDGPEAREKYLLRLMDQHRLKGEWFAPAPAVLRLLHGPVDEIPKLAEPGDELLTADEVAAMLRVGRRYVLRLARNGHLARVKADGMKTVYFVRADVEGYIEAGRGRTMTVGRSAARVIDVTAMPSSGGTISRRRRF